MALELIDTKSLKFHKKPRAVFQGYMYIFQKQCNHYRRWKCCRLFTHGCPGVLRTSLDVDNVRVLAVDHEHSHPDDTSAINDLKMQLVINDSMGTQKNWYKLMNEKREKENFKHFVPEDIAIHKSSDEMLMAKDDFHIKFDCEISENINMNLNSLAFQINKSKAAYSQNEIEKNNNHSGAKNYDENIEERIVTDNHTSLSDSGSFDKPHSSILRNILTSAKNNCNKISKNLSTEKEIPYAEMLRKKIKDMLLNAQMKTNVLETVIENNANTKNKSNIENNIYYMNNCKRIYSGDTDSINNNNKKMCIDKIQSSINSKTDYTDINSIHNDDKTINFVRDDNTNNTCNTNMIETDTSINGDKNIHVDTNKDINTKEEVSDFSINCGKKVHVNDDEYDKMNAEGDITSFFKNDFGSNNMGKIIQNMNNLNIGKKVFNNLLQTFFISHIIYSSDFGYQLQKFRTRNIQWKKKIDNLVSHVIQMKKDSKRIINRNKYLRKRVQPQMRDVGVQSYNIDAKEVKTSKQFFNQENNPKIMPNITQSTTSETASSKVICWNKPFNQVNTDATENFELKVLNSDLTPKSSQVIPNVTEKVESIVLTSKFTPKSKILKTVNSVLQKQRVPKKKIEDSSSATTIPLITKYIPKESVLGIHSKNELKQMSLVNMIKFLKARHFPNTKTFNCKLFYAMIIQKTNTKPISKTIKEKNVKKLSNRIVVLEKRSLPDVVQSSQVFKNNCYSHIRKRHLNYEKIICYPSQSVHLRILHEEIIRYKSNEIFGPFLEKLTDAERYSHPPRLEATVFVSFMTNPPKAVLKWNFDINIHSKIIENIIDYEIVIMAFHNNKLISDGWEQIGIIKALKLPMTCTIQLDPGDNIIYYFAVRARDVNKRYGPFCISSPVKI